MSELIVFDLGAAQEAQNRLDDGLFTDEEKPRLMELAALYEGYCQQEYGRFQEEVERAERALWLATQCGGCVEGGSGELCDEHWIDASAVCDTCGTPETSWDTTHRLHLPGSGQCPNCRQTDIHEDVAQDRREEG